MKPIIVFCLALVASSIPLFGQLGDFSTGHPVCELPAAPFEEYLYVPPPAPPSARSSATIIVNYLNSGTVFGQSCTPWPAKAQAAMGLAATIWGSLLNTSTTITVNACWASTLGGRTLGSAGATAYLGSTIRGEELTWYPVALLEHLANDPGLRTVEIQAAFSANRTDWYFGLDGQVPSDQIDFTTVALHELGHGLGFAGFENLDNGEGSVECDGVDGHGCYGARDGRSIWAPDIFTRQVENSNRQQLSGISNPSQAVGALLLGQNGGLFIGSPSVRGANGNTSAKIYTPGTYTPGSTYSHWDLDSYPNEVMKPQLRYGQAIHHPGLALNLLEDLGWPVGSSVLPVEWVAFTAEAREEAVQLNWETAHESNNAGFEVQRSRNGRQWETLDFIKARGAAADYTFTDRYPFLGANYYRLLQSDLDGKAEYSDIETAHFGRRQQQAVGIAPNPATHSLAIGYAGYSEPLPYFIYSAMGETLIKGQLKDSRQEVAIEQLPKGPYWLQVGQESPLPFVKR